MGVKLPLFVYLFIYFLSICLSISIINCRLISPYFLTNYFLTLKLVHCRKTNGLLSENQNISNNLIQHQLKTPSFRRRGQVITNLNIFNNYNTIYTKLKLVILIFTYNFSIANYMFLRIALSFADHGPKALEDIVFKFDSKISGVVSRQARYAQHFFSSSFYLISLFLNSMN